MDKASKSVLFLSVLFTLFISSCAQSCNSYSFTNNRQFRTCAELSALSSSIHWDLDASTNTVEIAFRHRGTTPSQWVAWALNPSGQRMLGSQAIIAFQNSTGIRAYATQINSIPPTLQEGSLSYGVSDISATLNNGVMTIYARLQLTNQLLSTNQVWQEGPMTGGNPGPHPMAGENFRSFGTIDFRTGQAGSTGGGSIAARQRRRNTHGILNAVSWGTLMPMGVITARYLKVFKFANPAWFYLHAACQSSAYIVGIAGWAMGLKLGEESVGVQYNTHRAIGITLFCLGTLQVFALLLRPKPDHKYRIYWNIYHHAIGYATISLSIVNVYEGLDILAPGEKWRWVYSGILIFLGAVAVTLEAITWFICIKRKKQDNIDKQNPPHTMNGTNGVNGA